MINFNALIACSLPANDAAYDVLSALGSQLRLGGIELVVCGPDTAIAERDDFSTIVMPSSLVEQGERYPRVVSAADLPLSGGILDRLLALEDVTPSVVAELAVQKSAALWASGLEVMQPTAILTWGRPSSFSELLHQLARAAHIPAYPIEYGFSRQTLALGGLLQAVRREITFDAGYGVEGPAAERTADRWASIAAFYTAQAASIETSPDEAGDHWLASAPQRAGRKVLVLGSDDPAYSNPADTCRGYMQALGSQGDVEVWYKPASGPAVLFGIPETPDEVGQVDVHDTEALFRAADVVVPLRPEDQIWGFVFDRPQVALGTSVLAGFDADHVAPTEADLKQAVDEALADPDIAGRLARGRAALCAMHDRDLIALTDHTPCPTGLDDLARFVDGLKPLALPGAWDDRRATLEALMQSSTGEGSLEAYQLEISRLEAERTDRSSELLGLEKNVVELRANSEALTAAKEQLDHELAAQRQGAADLQARLETERNAAAELQTRLETERNAAEALRTRIEMETQAAAASQARFDAEREASAAHLAETHAMAGQRIGELERHLAAERESLNGIIARSDQDRAAFDDRVAEMLGSQAILHDQLTQARDAIDRHRHEADARIAALTEEKSAINRDLDRAQDAVERTRAVFTERVSKLTAQITSGRADLTRERRQASIAETAADARLGMLSTLFAAAQADVAQVRDAATRERKDLEGHIASLSADLAASREATTLSEKARSQAEAARAATIDTARLALATVEDELAQARAQGERDRVRLETQVSERQQEVEDLAAQLSGSWAATQSTQDRLVEAQNELAALREAAAGERLDLETRIIAHEHQNAISAEQLSGALAQIDELEIRARQTAATQAALLAKEVKQREAAIDQATQVQKENWDLVAKLSEAWAGIDKAEAAADQAAQVHDGERQTLGERAEAAAADHAAEVKQLQAVIERYRQGKPTDYARWAIQRAKRP